MAAGKPTSKRRLAPSLDSSQPSVQNTLLHTPYSSFNAKRHLPAFQVPAVVWPLVDHESQHHILSMKVRDGL